MASLKNISPESCNNTVSKLFEISTSLVSITSDNLYNLRYFCAKGYESEDTEAFTTPMVWIGMYMAVASFICIVCMVADSFLVRKERYQIPSKYFSLNTASMMVISIAMKLTVDLSGSMPGNLDQITKIGSIAFMCTIMAILNPSLASMNNRTLLSNIIGLAIFVVTIAVNLLIQIGTGVIKDEGPKHHISTDNDQWKVVSIDYSFDFVYIACVYIGIMLFLLLISISTAIIIPSIKNVLEFKYQLIRRNKALNEQQQQDTGNRIPTLEEVTQHVTRYWVMAKSGSPQFVMACNLLSYTSLLLCVTGMCLYIYMLTSLHETNAYDGNFESDYQWSISVILWTQVTGNVIGTVILVSRCFTSMKFKVHKIFTSKGFRIFTLRKEKYWTQKLGDWQGSHSHLGFLSTYPIRSRILIHHTKKVVLNLFILLQFAFVQFNQLIVSPFMLIMEYIIKFEDDSRCRLFTNDNIKDDDDLKNYVLQLEDEEQVKPSKRIVQSISKSMNRLIERTKKKQNDDLLKLLDKSSKGFKGIESFDDIDPALPHFVKLNSWSVPVITLTCIAIAVPDVSKAQVDSLIKNIDEALLYTHHVDKSFDSEREYVYTRKAAMTLWGNVIGKRRTWLRHPIGEGACGQLPRDILTWFAAKADPIMKVNMIIDNLNELIAAHSMHYITRSILSKYPDEIETKERFFEHLCSMIADILLACFSNLPQVIMMKCHAKEIEKREASVVAAAKLLGRTTEIIRKLEACELPSMDPEKMGSIDEWRLHLKSSFP